MAHPFPANCELKAFDHERSPSGGLTFVPMSKKRHTISQWLATRVDVIVWLVFSPLGPKKFVRFSPVLVLVQRMPTQANMRVVLQEIVKPTSHLQNWPKDFIVFHAWFSTTAFHFDKVQLNREGNAIVINKARKSSAWVFAGSIRAPCNLPQQVVGLSLDYARVCLVFFVYHGASMCVWDLGELWGTNKKVVLLYRQVSRPHSADPFGRFCRLKRWCSLGKEISQPPFPNISQYILVGILKSMGNPSC